MMNADRRVRHSGAGQRPEPRIQKHILTLYLDSGLALRAPRNERGWFLPSRSPRRRGLERALGERAGERAPVGGAGVDVILRLDLGGSRLANPDGERLVDHLAVER